MPYPEQVRADRSGLGQVSIPTVAAPKKAASGPNALLHHLEQGRLAQVSGELDVSIAHYEQAIKLAQDWEFTPWVSVSNTGRQGASLLVNDNALLYRGEGYERVLLHVFQALNFLMTGDLEAAAVEARRASGMQTRVLANYERELLELEERTEKVPVNLSSQSRWQESFAATDTAAQRVKNAVQVGYGYYVTGLIFELAGYADSAYVDYKRALELAPDSRVLQNAIYRLGHELGHSNDLQALETLGMEPLAPLQGSEGELVVLLEQGLVPEKREAGLVFYWDERWLSFAFPTYPSSSMSSLPLRLSASHGNETAFDPLADVSALAARALQDKRWPMLARQVGRIIAKNKLYRASEENAGVLGAVLANIYGIVSERADLRSWLTLPASAQVATMRLPEGSHTITIAGAGSVHSVPVTIEPSAHTVLHVVQAGSRWHVKTITLKGEDL